MQGTRNKGQGTRNKSPLCCVLCVKSFVLFANFASLREMYLSPLRCGRCAKSFATFASLREIKHESHEQ